LVWSKIIFPCESVFALTIHAAKGLEFPIVFVTGLEEGLFPISGAVENQNELEEERRLMYVAMTRAMHRLYLSYAVTRYRFGDLAYSTRSRFLDEIDPSVITVTGDQRDSHARASRRGFDSVEAPVHLSPQRRRKPADETAQYFTDTMPSYEEESQEPAAIRVGMRVVHASFGKGRIIALDGRGEKARAIVEFETVGRKHLMLKYAHLRVQ